MPMNIVDVKPIPFPLHGDVLDKGRSVRIAILAEGFVSNADSQQFRKVAREVTNYLIARRPYCDYLDRFAVVAIDCKSKTSAQVLRQGTRRPYDNMTPFDATFQFPGMRTGTLIPRGMSCNADAVRAVAAAAYPNISFSAHLVIVNSTEDGGEALPGEAIACLTMEDAGATFFHELGHALADLMDEYEYFNSESATPYSGDEVPFVNVSTQVSSSTMKWWDFLSPVDIPSTEADSGSCSRNHDAKDSDYEAFGVVGAFEGAFHYSCGIYRPSFDCRMRNDVPFCPVCANAIRRKLVGSRFLAAWSFWPQKTKPPKSQETVKTDGLWTHVLDISGLYGRQAPKDGMLLLYEATTGTIALLENLYVKGLLKHRNLPNPGPLFALTGTMQAFVDSGWMTLTAFSVGDQPFVTGTRFDSGQRTFIKVIPQNSFAGGAFQNVSSDIDSDGPWTHVVAFELSGTTHLLSYNYLNGRVALDEMTDNMGVPLANRLASYDWVLGWNHVVVLDRGGQPLIAMLNTVQRVAQILEPQRPDAAGSVLNTIWLSDPNFLPAFITHCAGISFQGQPLLITCAMPGVVAIHSVRAPGRPLLDFNERRALGFAGLTLLGTGAPAIGAIEEHLWFYGAASADFRFLELA